METILETKIPPNFPKYFCEYCGIKTNYKKDYNNHLLTAKHIKLTKVNDLITKTLPISQNHPQIIINKTFACEICYKEYKSRVGLWKHKKSCCYIENNNIEEKKVIVSTLSSDKDLIMMLVKQNTELMEILKNGTNNNSNNTNTNCMNNNKTFNLQFFLNETCKDAMNINDFVESIKLQLSDLEKMGEVGYIEGLSNIITSNLKVMDVTERPVHCTDKKRETIYIKDDNKWEKEDDNKTKLRKAIKKISSKNFKLMSVYREKYPGCQFAESKQSDKYNKLMIEALGGEGDNDKEKEDKIIHNISKSIVIDK
jgi:hypothetical protein